MIDIAFAKPALPERGALALLIAEGDEPAGLAAALDEATGGALVRALAAANFTGKHGQSAILLAPGAGLDRVVAIGLGKLEDLTPHRAETAGAVAAAALLKDATAALAADGIDATLLAHAALGARLRSYRFDKYRTTLKAEQKPKLRRLAVLTAETAAVSRAWKKLDALATGVELTRNLVSEPANILNPVEMAERAKALKSLGVKVEVMGQRELEKLGFGALLGVAQGSVNEPRMVVMQWLGASQPETSVRRGGKTAAKEMTKTGKKGRPAAQDPVVFVGKGVTFDTGGISIKPAAGMEDMKWDMAGAGTVIGLMAALAGRRARVDAIGLVGLVENMPSGNAQRPGDVVKSYSGQTIEVLNTDAEGRLVLADVLWYAQKRFKPRFMVDLATLTGAIIVALGHENAGLFSNDDALAAQLVEAGKSTGEGVWRMPLGKAYDRLIDGDIADMKNIGGRAGGSITAAQFLQRFVNDTPWAHLDIAGMAWATKNGPLAPKGATGFGVRLLDRLVANHYEQ